MEEEKGRNNQGIFPVAILFTAEISHVIPAMYLVCQYIGKSSQAKEYMAIYM